VIPQAGQSDLWLQGAILRLVLVAWIVYCLLVFVLTGSGERLALLSILLVGSFAQAAFGIARNRASAPAGGALPSYPRSQVNENPAPLSN